MRDTSKKKIFFVLPNLRGGGAERVMLTIAGYIAQVRSDWVVAVVVFSREGEYKDSVPENVSLYDLKASRARYAFGTLFRLCWRERPDIVVSTMQATTVFFLIRLFLWSKPLFMSRLENVYTYDVQSLSLVTRLLFRTALEHCDRVIVPAKGMIDDLVGHTHVQRKRIICIYNPVDITNVEHLSKAGNCLELQHPAIVMCGRLTKQKGYPHALQVFSVLKGIYPEAQLYILGDGEDRESLQKEIDTKDLTDAVHLCGFVENPYTYFARADVFMLTSLWEGFGLVLVEAMACGVPVVSFNSPTGPSEILLDSTYGILTPHMDVPLMVDAVQNLLSDEYRRLEYIAKGKKRATEFTVERIGETYVELFET